MKQSMLLTIALVLFTVLLQLGPAVCGADEVLENINEAIKHYNSGDYSAAVTSLDYAAQLIRQKKGGTLESFLPDPLTGWKAEKASSQAVSATMFGGGVSAERNYTKGSSRVSVKIAADSPVLSGMMMMINNPMMVSSSDSKLETINGQKAMVRYTDDDKSGTVTIAVANKYLITIEGDEVSRNDLIEYTKKIDLKKLAELK